MSLLTLTFTSTFTRNLILQMIERDICLKRIKKTEKQTHKIKEAQLLLFKFRIKQTL